MKLANKVAIITGAAGGMGQAAAILFAQEGARDRGDRSQGECGSTDGRSGPRASVEQAIAIGADITSTEDVKRIVSRTVAELGTAEYSVQQCRHRHGRQEAADPHHRG